MDTNSLVNVGLITLGGGLFGYTLYQIAARKISTRQIGASVSISLGGILLGFSFMPRIGHAGMLLEVVGAVSLISGTLLTARQTPARLPPSASQRIEGPKR